MTRRPYALRGLSLSISIFIFAAFALVSQNGFAQEVTAGITGAVTDPSGAPIVGATATATDTQHGTIYTVKTNDAGVYNITRIPIGTYQV